MEAHDLMKLLNRIDFIQKDLEYIKHSINESIKTLEEENKPVVVEEEVITEKITEDQLIDLHNELSDYPITTQSLLRGLKITQLSDMPKAKYHEQLRIIRKNKLALINSPSKEW